MLRRIYCFAAAVVIGSLAACGGVGRQHPKPSSPTNPATNAATVDLDAASPPPAAPVESPASRKAAPAWHPAASPDPLSIGGCQVRIASAIIGKVPLEYIIGDDASESTEEFLLIKIEITNTTERKKIDFQSWSSPLASLSDIDASLIDDAGNEYGQVGFGASTRVAGALEDGSIYPAKSVIAAISFEPPVEGIKHLRLELSAKAIGGADGELRFEIPADFVTPYGSF